MTNPNIRQGFYQGQKVTPEHLNTLQDYADKGANSLALDVLGYGVVQGFELSILEDFTIEITAGSAFNQIGERLVLDSGVPVDLSILRPTAGQKIVKIGIKKKYIGSGTVVDILGKDIDTILTPSVDFFIGESLEEGVFELAEAKLDANGVQTITKTASELITIPKQVAKTQALTCTEEQANLHSQILSLLAQNSTSIESPLINLITQNLQINGTPYMEIGVNDNGHYVKFESGLLICFDWRAYYSTIYWIFPMPFKNTAYSIIANFDIESGDAHMNFSKESTKARFYDISYINSVNNPLAIGFWK